LAKDLIDNDVMALDEALALSNNLVYAKVALSLCGGDRERAAQQLKAYADKFSISGEINGQNLPFAACGLSETYVSLVNAAALMSSIANGGLLVKPSVVQSVIDKNGELVFQRQHSGHQRVFNGAAAQEMMEMARKTTCCYGFSDLEAGTARGAFFDNFRPKLKGVSVSAKTGSISNKGQQVRWFVATPETWGRAEYGMSYPIQSGLSIAVCTLGAVVPYVAPNLGKAIIEKLLRGEGEFSLKVDQNDHFIFL
jgi:membrane peptidoglycan carboxypeptidase